MQSRLNIYAALHLAANPFTADLTPGVPERLWVPREAPAAPEPGGRRFVQVVGVKGAGKTSLLTHWRRTHPGPYAHVPPGVRRWRIPPFAAVCYWDEADRLPAPLLWVALRLARRRGATVIVGTHRDLSGSAGRAGFAVETVEFGGVSPAFLAAWCERRVAAVALPGCDFRVPPDVIAAVANSCGGCLRTAGDRLHVWAAERAAAALRGNGDSSDFPPHPVPHAVPADR